MKFNITSNVNDFMRKLKRHKRQVPFATSKAINATLRGARPYLIRHIKRRQRSNKAWWNNKITGINRQWSNKRRLQGAIYTKMYWADEQEFGGYKVPHRGKHLAVPTNKAPAYARKSGGTKRLMQGKRVFATKTGIYRRKGPKGRSSVEKLHTFKLRTKVKPMLGFYTTVGKYVRRNFPREHRKALIYAIRTAR